MRPMSDVKNILLKLMEARGWTEYRLAEESGVNQSTLNAIFTGRSTQPRDPTLKPLADCLGVSLSQLRGYESIPDLDVPGSQNRHLANKYPVVSGDDLEEWLQGKLAKSDLAEHLPSSTTHSKSVFPVFLSIYCW